MRKLSNIVKAMIGVFAGVVVIAVAAGAVLIVRQQGASAAAVYAVTAGSTVYDGDNAQVDMTAGGQIRLRADGKYYLTTETGDTYCLGEQAVYYDQNTAVLHLLGDGYRVYSDSSVKKISGETQISDLVSTAFYKLGDRRYVLIAPEITDSTGTVRTSQYLFCVLDRAGNALLLNHEINYKTTEATVLYAGEDAFDIAEEMLLFGGSTIDLSMIFGSTNEYNAIKEAREGEEQQDTIELTIKGGSGGDGGTGGSGGDGGSGGSGGMGGDGGSGGLGGSGGSGGAGGAGGTGGTGVSGSASSYADGRYSMNLSGVTQYVNMLNVYYNVVDPFGNYGTVFLVVRPSEGTEQEIEAGTQTIVLDVDASSVGVYGLNPDTRYTLELCYVPVEANATSQIDDVMRVETLAIEHQIYVMLLADGQLTVNVRLDSRYQVDSARLYLDVGTGAASAWQDVDIAAAVSAAGWTTTLTYTDSYYGALLNLRFADVKYAGADIELSNTTSLIDALPRTGGTDAGG